MQPRFTGRVALVTGGARGIGQAIAARFAAEEARVVIADVDADAGQRTAAELAEDGRDVTSVGCDVTDRAAVDATVAAVVARYGRLDVLVCNVGVAGGTDIGDIDDAEWDRQVDPTLHGTVRCVQAALPHLLESPAGGAVVMIGSVNGLGAFGDLAYSAAKAALGNVAANLTVRYGAQMRELFGGTGGPVRFNVVAPGTIRTRVWDGRDVDELAALYPMGRVGEPADIANAVAFLASDDAAWISGIVLPVDGGVLAAPAQGFAHRHWR